MPEIRKTVFLVFIMIIALVLVGCAEETQKNEVNLTAKPEEGGEVIGGGRAYEVKETIPVHARPAEGYVFEKWTENGEKISTDETYELEVKDGRQLVGHFAEGGVIKDSNLIEVLQEKLDIEAPIQKEDLKELTFLSANRNNIKNLSGLEYAENLQY